MEKINIFISILFLLVGLIIAYIIIEKFLVYDEFNLALAGPGTVACCVYGGARTAAIGAVTGTFWAAVDCLP